MNSMAPATRPNQISDWEKQFFEGATAVFESSSKPLKVNQEPNKALLYK